MQLEGSKDYSTTSNDCNPENESTKVHNARLYETPQVYILQYMNSILYMHVSVAFSKS